ncbi:MAG: coenzyme F420-0:L-glutamate ligase [Chloroflexi bacterium]|nr:coenzyme F420-0:L-glutamate ligase [Chloroflexota bacterium]
MKNIQVVGLTTIPEIKAGDNLAQLIVECARNEAGGIQEKDIIVITAKVVSKAENLVIDLRQVKPGKKASDIAHKVKENPAVIQLMMDHGHKLIAAIPLTKMGKEQIRRYSSKPEMAVKLLEEAPNIVITRDKAGRLSNNGGIDGSNHPEGFVSLPPPDPDKAALELRQNIRKLTGKEVAVIISDTTPYLFGSLDLPIGSSGIETVARKFAEKDRFGRPKYGGVDLIAYELTGAAALLIGQASEGIPVAVIKGFDYRVSEEENVANTLLPDTAQLWKVAGAAITLTASIGGIKSRIKGRLLRWMVGA